MALLTGCGHRVSLLAHHMCLVLLSYDASMTEVHFDWAGNRNAGKVRIWFYNIFEGKSFT